MKAEQFAAHQRVEQSHWWFTARRAVLLGLVGRLLPPGGAVLDLGCGTGGNAAAFAAAGYRVMGPIRRRKQFAWPRPRILKWHSIARINRPLVPSTSGAAVS
jgi:hypothetical protein